MTRILFVEDDANLGLLLTENLVNKGLNTTWCKDGEDALARIAREQFDLCVLDVMLPVMDGFTLARRIRAIGNEMPIVFLTARGMHEDKMKGFELGGDDYITKPFNTQELYMRINAILRRMKLGLTAGNSKTFSLGAFVFDHTKMTLQKGGEVKKLSLKESELLHILISNKNEFVPRNVILEKIWGNDDYFSAKSMDVYISKIRKLLREDPAVEILNAYGIGFKMIIHT